MKRSPGLRSNLIIALAALAVGASALAARAETFMRVPAPAAATLAGGAEETAYLAGGCFWGIQGVFAHVKGVKQVVSGYAGGAANTAHYETVSTGRTGHAETVKITFDPKQVSYGQILRIFFSVATDPTQLNRQFPDTGTQYRSEIFYADAAQAAAARAYIAQLDAAKVYPARIATRVDPIGGFYPAEDHHQNYLTLHPAQPYIAIYDLPKVAALKRLFPGDYRETPVLAPVAKG